MSRALLEFDLDRLDGKAQYDAAIKGILYKNAFRELVSHLKGEHKNGNEPRTPESYLGYIERLKKAYNIDV